MSFNSKYTGAQVENWIEEVQNRLPLSGGTITGDLNINSSNSTTIRYFRMWYYGSNRVNRGMISVNANNVYLSYYSPTDGIVHELSIGRQGYKINDKDLIHSGNISSQNVYSATKLKTAITLWGRNFDGTASINGELFDVKAICTFAQGTGTYGIWKGSIFSSNLANEDLVIYGNKVVILGDKVGLGVMNPLYKLDLAGDIHCTGTLVQDSDIRLKNITNNIKLPLSDIAEAPLFEFTYKNDENKRIHVGTSAQYWAEKNNWFCKKQDNGYYDMEIQNLALASAISVAKEFKKYKEETESTISSMKKEIEELKQIILNMNK